MKPNPEPVTGWEPNADGTSPYRALCEYYRAFNARDLPLLTRNWAQSEDVSIDDPMTGVRRGWRCVREVYERLLDGPALLRVELVDYTIHEAGDLAWFVGLERGYVRARREEVPLAIRATLMFRRMDGRWRQVHHHGSIDDPRLLARYQGALQGVFATLPAAEPRNGVHLASRAFVREGVAP